MKKELLKLFFKQFGRKPKDQLEWLQWRFKNSQQSGKGQILRPDFGKKNPWYKGEGEGEVIDTSFRPNKKVNMSNEDYSSLKDEWFTKIIANTDDALNTFLKRGIDKADKRFSNLTQNQRKDFLNMVDYRLKHGNKKFMNDFTDAKGEFKLPEDLAGGGLAGMLGEPTYQDDSHRVPYKDAKLVEGSYMPPKNIYNLGFGSILDDVMRDTPKKGTWTGKDLEYLWDVLQGDQDRGIEDLMLRFGRDNPEKKSSFFTEIGKDKAGVGWKKQFNEGGRVPFKVGGKGKALEGLAKLFNEFFPGTTKLGKRSKPYPEKIQEKMDLRKSLAGFLEREKAAKLKKLKTWEDPDKVRAAVDDIFSSGDYKMDAEMASEALVENNPKAFGGKLLDDLDDATRSDIYGAVLKVVQSDLAKMLQLKRASKPTKTLEGIKKTGTINISDPNVADEFSRFMKETDPKGHKKLEQTVDLMNLDIKGKKGHASGGLAGMLGE